MRIAGAAVYVVAVLWLAAPSAAAQQIGGGFEGGLNFAGLSVDPNPGVSTSASPGLLIGGFATVSLTPIISLQPEFLFAQRRFDVSSGGRTALVSERWSAIEFPVLARFDFKTGGQSVVTSVYAVAGVGFSALVGATEVTISSGRETDVKNNLTGGDVALVVGGGVLFGQFGVEGRYNGGSRELDPAPGRNDPTTHSRAFSVLVRYHVR